MPAVSPNIPVHTRILTMYRSSGMMKSGIAIGQSQEGKMASNNASGFENKVIFPEDDGYGHLSDVRCMRASPHPDRNPNRFRKNKKKQNSSSVQQENTGESKAPENGS